MHRRRQAVFIRGEEAAMSQDQAERWLRANDPERRPKPPTTLTLKLPIEGVPPRTVKIEEEG
jgi:hypothetical protein